MQDRVQKATSILDLSETGSRIRTIGSLLENILYLYNEMLTAEQIAAYVHDIFAVQLSISEINTVLATLVESRSVSARGGKYVVTDECYKKIREKEVGHSGSVNNRLGSYRETLKTLAPDINEDEAKEFWALFTSYVCLAVYSYSAGGLRSALSEDFENTEYILRPELISFFANKIENSDHRELFINSCIAYINGLDAEALDYYEGLGKNLISFYALAFPQLWEKPVDWVIFADSDFLSAVLSLDNKPETLACKALLKLVKESNLNVKFKFLPITLMELAEQKPWFEKLIPTATPEIQFVKAMLQTGGLDSVSKAWYEHYLNDSSTLHPSRLIDTSEKTLTSFAGFEKYNYRFETVFNEEYISTGISDYKKYISLANSTRVVNGYEADKRTTEQLQHDVLLREAIGQLRKENSDPSIVYIGLSSDELMINYNNRDNSGNEMPRFFRPSFLLNILARFLTVQPEGYKIAFVKAMTALSLTENMEGSRQLQEFVSYYSQRGLTDEKLLINFISDHSFLKAFSQKSESERGRFFESELNNRANAAGTKAGELMMQLNEVMQELARTKQDANSNEAKIKLQEHEIQSLKEKQLLFESELKKLVEEKQKKVQINQELKTPAQLNGEVEVETAVEPDFNIQSKAAPISNKKTKKRVLAGIGVLVFVCLVGMLLAVGYIYIDSTPARYNPTLLTDVSALSSVPQTVLPEVKVTAPDTLKNEISYAGIDTLHEEIVKTDTIIPVKPRANSVPVLIGKPKSTTSIFEAKVRKDIIGSKLSGCDIIIKSTSEIAALGNLVLVEKLSSGALKYKFTAKITQGKETYSTAPYIYYTVDGTFIKIDGTNCE